ncbi:MAG: sigma-70 family RNA polymerase sigma factor [Oscillospiraceae bacterium]|nr:sigma-70 family RNA polymerase sigma factor [Oscillospiraceae bacterium]
MDSTAHEIVEQVYQAKNDSRAADELIAAYMPFIKSETAKFLKRPPEAEDDELSIAMFAFYESICKYSKRRGSFLSFAALQIKNRLIDNYRRESRNKGHISLDTTTNEDEDTELMDTIQDPKNAFESNELRDATRAEISELSTEMETFGVSMQEVTEDSPRQQRTLEICRKAVSYAKGNPEILSEFMRTKRVPLAKIAKGAAVERKPLERHRRYLVAVLLICAKPYEILWQHIVQVFERGGES